jgi:hypothetical protein
MQLENQCTNAAYRVRLEFTSWGKPGYLGVARPLFGEFGTMPSSWQIKSRFSGAT